MMKRLLVPILLMGINTSLYALCSKTFTSSSVYKNSDCTDAFCLNYALREYPECYYEGITAEYVEITHYVGFTSKECKCTSKNVREDYTIRTVGDRLNRDKKIEAEKHAAEQKAMAKASSEEKASLEAKAAQELEQARVSGKAKVKGNVSKVKSRATSKIRAAKKSGDKRKLARAKAEAVKNIAIAKALSQYKADLDNAKAQMKLSLAQGVDIETATQQHQKAIIKAQMMHDKAVKKAKDKFDSAMRKLK